MTRKIKNWKKENKINDECDEQLENKRVNVSFVFALFHLHIV